MIYMSTPPAKPTTCGVKISTWGTKPGAGNGLLHFLDFKLFGGNVGHVSVAVTFPATDENKKLIEKYCHDPDPYKDPDKRNPIIPYVKKKVVISPDGKTEEVYEVYFSWWPNRLNKNESQDSADEWAGVGFDWSPEWAEKIKPEKRRYGGFLGNRILTLGPKNIVHQRAMTSEEYEELNLRAKQEAGKSKLESLKILSKKLDTIAADIANGKSKGLSLSETLLLDNLIPNWKDKIPNKNKLTTIDLTNLKNGVLEVEKHLKEEKEAIDIQLQSTTSAKKLASLKEQETSWDYALQDANYFRDFLLIHKDKGLEKNSEALDKYKKLTANLDKKFKWDESQKRIINSENIDPATLQSILEIANKNIQEAKNNKQKSIDEQRFLLEKAEKRLENWSKGHPPDNVVSLPISSVMEGGLEVEKMLETMQALSNRAYKDYDIYTKNCSKTVAAILEAGAHRRPDLQDYFKNAALGFFGNPQEVYNNSVKFQAALLKREKPGKISSIMRYNPLRSGGALEKMGGYLIGVWLEGNPLEKTGAFLGGLVIAPLAFANFLVKKVFNPLDSFNGLMGLGAYAFSRNSKVIKGVGIVCYVLAAAFSVPAALQAAILKIASRGPEPTHISRKHSQEKLKQKKSALEKKAISKTPKTPKPEPQKQIKRKSSILKSAAVEPEPQTQSQPQPAPVIPDYEHIVHPTSTQPETTATNNASLKEVQVKLQKWLDKVGMEAGSSLNLKLLFDGKKKLELVRINKALPSTTATAAPVPKKVIMTVTEEKEKTKFRFNEKPTKTIAQLALDAADPPILLSSTSISDIQLFSATASTLSPPKLLRFDEPTIKLIQNTNTLKNDPNVKAILDAQKMEPPHEHGPHNAAH